MTKKNDLICFKSQGYDQDAELVREHREAVRIKKAKEGWTDTEKMTVQLDVVKKYPAAASEDGAVLKQQVRPLQQQDNVQLEASPTHEAVRAPSTPVDETARDAEATNDSVGELAGCGG